MQHVVIKDSERVPQPRPDKYSPRVAVTIVVLGTAFSWGVIIMGVRALIA